MTPVGTIYRRAIVRVKRRSAAYLANPSAHAYALLGEAVRLANELAR